MKDLFEVLGTYLQNKRLKAELSQGDVADKLGYSSPQFISNFERGLCAPPLPKLRILIDLYDLNPEEVVKIMLGEHEKHLRKHLKAAKGRKK
jgi:transcriptional regulator with XRE-family HTH domain